MKKPDYITDLWSLSFQARQAFLIMGGKVSDDRHHIGGMSVKKQLLLDRVLRKQRKRMAQKWLDMTNDETA